MTHLIHDARCQPTLSGKLRPVVRVGLLSLLLLARATNIAAGEKRQPSPPLLTLAARATNAEELRIEVAAHNALRHDPQLGELNLYVRIEKGIAYLEGEVPSMALKQQAIRRLGRVEGVLEVRADRLYVRKAAQTKKRLELTLDDGRPTQTRSASPKSFMSRSESGSDSQATAKLSEPGGTPLPSTINPTSPVAPTQRVTLLAPETAPPPSRTPEAARLTANPRPRPQGESLAATVERLQRGHARFQQIRMRVQDTTVCIYAGQTPVEDVMTFAQSVRRLPGVLHVIVQNGSSSR